MTNHKRILTMNVDVTSKERVLESVHQWVATDKGYYICVSNVHMCMETWDNKDFASVVNAADLVIPDGRPIYWAQKLLGANNAQQVRGMDVTFALCHFAEQNQVSVGFYGGAESTLADLQRELLETYPQLKIDLLVSPPFRELSKDEKQQAIEDINASGVKILFVGLGCPKQEFWMAEHKPQLHCVALGVGAAFDFIAGNKKHAPQWLQRIGFEWLFRLISEPKRLWHRYFSTNPRFIGYFLLQLLGRKF